MQVIGIPCPIEKGEIFHIAVGESEYDIKNLKEGYYTEMIYDTENISDDIPVLTICHNDYLSQEDYRIMGLHFYQESGDVKKLNLESHIDENTLGLSFILKLKFGRFLKAFVYTLPDYPYNQVYKVEVYKMTTK